MNESDFTATFAKVLTDLLARDKKTQRELARHMKVSTATVSDWCNAKKMPRVDKLTKLAHYFGVPRSYLIEGKSLDAPARWSQLDPEDRKTVERLIEAMLQAPKYRALFQPDKIREA